MEDLVEFSWGTMHWLAGARGQAADSMAVARMTLRPGASNEFHHHERCEEVVLLLSGRVEHRVGDKTIIQRPGDWTLIPKTTSHRSFNPGGCDAVMFITYGAAERDYVRDE